LFPEDAIKLPCRKRARHREKESRREERERNAAFLFQTPDVSRKSCLCEVNLVPYSLSGMGIYAGLFWHMYLHTRSDTHQAFSI